MNSEDENDHQEVDDESITSEDEGEASMQMDQHDSNIEMEKQKADALKKQIALWDSFLELRIKLQRATITCNCLPTSTIVDDDELRQVIDENAKLFRKTLALLLAIENRRSSKRVHDDDDAEVNNNNTETTEVFKTLSKRLKHGEQTVDDELTKTYERFVPERDTVVQKWFERTRGFAKQNKTNLVEQSPIVQIKEIMSLPDRLLKRTQTSRTDYDLICPPSSPIHPETSTDLTTKINPELFDDGDFYHQLLREYIERKTASITDPEQISKHWAQLRKLRTKLKRNLDTKASKDRKIRYNIHKKLVNYMAPIDRCSFTDEAKSDLFSSLFGTTKLTTTYKDQPPAVHDILII
jgi:protein AATF/BFR2